MDIVLVLSYKGHVSEEAHICIAHFIATKVC